MLRNKRAKKDILEQRDFSVIPNTLITNTQLSANEKLILIYLLNSVEGWAPSTRNLAERLSIHRNTVQTSLKVLESFNIIKVMSKTDAKIVVNSIDSWVLDLKEKVIAPKGGPRIRPASGLKTVQNVAYKLGPSQEENKNTKEGEVLISKKKEGEAQEETPPLPKEFEPEEFELPENKEYLEELERIQHSSNKYLS